MSICSSAPSSHQGRSSANGRSKVLPKYQASTMDRCFTNPSRLVPVGVTGRRTSYSDNPSSFQTIASLAWRR